MNLRQRVSYMLTLPETSFFLADYRFTQEFGSEAYKKILGRR